MFNNVVLDVFIGLIFIFLLYSLLATILQELISSRFGLRGRMLQKALRRMLEDGDDTKEGLWNRSSVKSFFAEAAENFSRFFNPFGNTASFLSAFYSHPSIKYLGEGQLFKKPSYLHGHNFSQTIIHLLRGEGYDGRTENESNLINQALQSGTFTTSKVTITINQQTLNQLKMLFADARQDSFLFKHKLEDWFEETMDRTTGWYKKQTQVILIWIGFGLATAFNVDTIAITKILLKDKNAREQIVEMAISRQKEYGEILDSIKTTIIRTEIKKDSITTTIDSVIKSHSSDRFLDSVRKNLQRDALEVQGILGLNGIPSTADSLYCQQIISYLDTAISKETDPLKQEKLKMVRDKAYECCLKDIKTESPYQKSAFLMIIGWLLTALAISLGAPFWFDLLNKFIKLRESGPKAGNISAIDSGAINNTGNNPVKDNTNSDIRG